MEDSSKQRFQSKERKGLGAVDVIDTPWLFKNVFRNVSFRTFQGISGNGVMFSSAAFSSPVP